MPALNFSLPDDREEIARAEIYGLLARGMACLRELNFLRPSVPALADNPDRPQLRFIEKNCVQCGLCASTCPEDAIVLEPRLLLQDGLKARKSARVLNEVEPFCCVRCGKPFGTLKAIESMAVKLGGHAMFQGAAAARLKMCGECRVIDIHTDPDEVRITQI